MKSTASSIALVVLAAGAGQRMGKAKQLLPWHGTTLIQHVIHNAITSNAGKVLVVLGAYYEEVLSDINYMRIAIISNPDWKTGQSSSIVHAVEKLEDNFGGIVFLKTDQPFVTTEYIRNLVEIGNTNAHDIVILAANAEWCGPALFKHTTFGALKNLKGNQGGKAIFGQFSVLSVDTQDPKLLVDLDTCEDYEKYRE